jgi:FkbM family methyltransferase
MTFILKTSKKTDYILETDDPVIQDWFDRPEETHVNAIIQQINDGMYDEYVKGDNLVIIDAGANIGLFSIYAQDSCKTLISVEPSPPNFYALERLLESFTHVHPEMSALTGANTTIPFYISEHPTCNSAIKKTDVKIDVQGKTIGQIINDHKLDHVDFVKCDIEGSEVDAITEQNIAEVASIVTSWLVEIHQTDTETSGWPGNLEENRQNLSRIFQNNGYQTKSIIHDQLYAWK